MSGVERSEKIIETLPLQKDEAVVSGWAVGDGSGTSFLATNLGNVYQIIGQNPKGSVKTGIVQIVRGAREAGS